MDDSNNSDTRASNIQDKNYWIDRLIAWWSGRVAEMSSCR